MLILSATPLQHSYCRCLRLLSCHACWKWTVSPFWCVYTCSCLCVHVPVCVCVCVCVCACVCACTCACTCACVHAGRLLLSTPPPPHFLTRLSSSQTNLHFTMASLFATLTSPSGAMEDSAVALSLVRLTYKHLVQTCAAACVLQYLLTCSPGMETDATG